jgi:sigma-B regulation protein RsbU (phosphoserine phosphatase)
MPTEHNPLPSAETLYASAACGLVLTDADGTIRHANTTFCAWMGYALADLVGARRIQDLLTVGGRIFHQTHWVPLLRMQGSIAEVKLELKHQDGRTFPVVMNAVSRQHGVRVFHELALFVAEDRHRYERELMQARKQAEHMLATQLEAQQALALAEARLRVAVETAQLHVWHADPATGSRYYDDAVAELLGRPGPEPVTAERFLAHLSAQDREREAEAFAEALDPAKGAYRCVFQLHGDDGTLRTVRATGNGVFNAAGELLRFVGVLQDVTEMSLQRTVAEGRARFAEQMVGIVSHDLRNPLTAIKMGMQMLDNPTLSPERRKRVTEHMDGSVDRAHRLVEDLLDFTQAKIGSGLTVTLALVDAHNVVETAVQELRLAFSGRTIAHMKAGDGAWWADANRLAQMLGNLVGNAMTYGDAERPVTVTTRTAADHFSLEVHNWGAPIPPALLPVLFEPMTRGTAAGGEQRSVGLGLFIVKDIVRAHSGRIDVTSSLEHGTTFRTTFPRSAFSVT